MRWLRIRIQQIGRMRRFRTEFEEFRHLASGRAPRFDLAWKDRRPYLDDRTPTTGFDRHYVFHTAWASRIVASLRPARHVDVASSVYFAAIVSAFVPVDFYEYRPAQLDLDGLRCGGAELTKLPFQDDSIPSLS